MDQIDPVDAGDVTTSSTAPLGTSGGTISIGATTSAQTAGTQTNLSFAHSVVAGNDRMLMVVVTTNAEGTTGTAGVVQTVTYGGTPMTFVGGRTSGGSGSAGANARVEFWRLLAPTVGSANVAITLVGGTGKEFAAGATNFTGVHQSTPLGAFSSNNGKGTSASVTAASAAGQVVLGGIAWDQVTGAINMGAGQTQLWQRNNGNQDGAASTEAGAGSVTTSYTIGNSQDWAVAMVPIRPSPPTLTNTSFTQTAPFGANFSMPAGGVISAEFYLNIISGSMPAAPSIEAVLRDGAGDIITLTNPTYAGGVLTFAGALPGNRTVLAGEQLEIEITTSQGGVTFQIDYDSVSDPSQIGLPTTTAILVDSIEVYGSPYPAGIPLSGAFNGQTVYVRTTISDPFGPTDITSVDLTISDPTPAVVVNTTLTDVDSVATTANTKTYEYEWATGVDTGEWTIDIVANEGSEGITDSGSLPFDVSPQDLGTPCADSFITFVGNVPTSSYAPASQTCAQVNDVDENDSPAALDVVNVTISGASGDDETIVLTETGVNTGIFRGCILSDPVVVGVDQNGSLFAPPGELLTLRYEDDDDDEATDVCLDNAIITTVAADVNIAKTRTEPASGTALAGDTVEFDILVSNPGPSTLTTVTVTDVFETACLTFDSANVAPDTVAPDTPVVGQTTITWNNVGPITTGNNLTLEVAFTANGGGACAPTVNSASASGTDEFATPVSDGPATANVTVVNPELTVVKTRTTPSPVDAGDPVSFDITVTNTGNTDIATLPLTDDFSDFCLTYDSAVPAPTGAGGGTIFWADLGPLATADPPINITVNFTAAAGCNPATNNAIVDSAVDVGGTPSPKQPTPTRLSSIRPSI